MGAKKLEAYGRQILRVLDKHQGNKPAVAAELEISLKTLYNKLNRYAEIGADMIFVEAPQSRDELARVAQEIPKPQLANMLVGGATPILSADELQTLGFKIVVSPIESLAVTAFAVERLAKAMLTEGRVDTLADRMWTFSEMKRLLGVEV